MPETPFSLRLYRWLLRLYPAGFREDYAELLERAFRDELDESTGAAALAILWIRLFADLAISIPSQFVREVTQDARHALRLWARHPWHTGFAILALAIGIGANTGVFSVVNALLLRSLPFRDPERLAYLSSFTGGVDAERPWPERHRLRYSTGDHQDCGKDPEYGKSPQSFRGPSERGHYVSGEPARKVIIGPSVMSLRRGL
jgi:hypothetical protein